MRTPSARPLVGLWVVKGQALRALPTGKGPPKGTCPKRPSVRDEPRLLSHVLPRCEQGARGCLSPAVWNEADVWVWPAHLAYEDLVLQPGFCLSASPAAPAPLSPVALAPAHPAPSLPPVGWHPRPLGLCEPQGASALLAEGKRGAGPLSTCPVQLT